MSNDPEGALARPMNSDLFRFIVVGISNIVVGYAVFAFALHLLGDFVLRGTVAQIIAYCVGTVWSYYWNRRWTFRSEAAVGGEASRFVVLQIICAIISTAGVGVAVDGLKLHPTGSWLVVVAFVSVINYVLSKRWVFVADGPVEATLPVPSGVHPGGGPGGEHAELGLGEREDPPV